MLSDSRIVVLGASFATYLVFHRYEPGDLSTVAFLLVGVPIALSALSLSSCTALGILLSFVSHWILILVFTVIYRLNPFHPLANYPGPILNKITKFRTFHTARRGRLHWVYKKLHQKYGDIVRVGPNELSYCNVDGVLSTLGINGLPKGPYNDNRHTPGLWPSLPFIRDAREHAKRRRFWNRAFSGSALKDYDQIIIRRTRELLNSLATRTSKKIDIAQWMGFFAYDFMGELAFSFSFDMMKEGKDIHGYWTAMHDLVQLAHPLSHLPYIMSVFRRFAAPKSAMDLDRLAKQMVDQRLDSGSVTRDLVYYLYDESSLEVDRPSAQQVFSEADTSIIAGSDTTATVLSNLCYYLIRKPHLYARLREEIDAAFSGEEPFDQQRLSEMPYLNACINESMRLQPPVASGSQRWVPFGTGGKMVGPNFVPEGSTIYIPTYCLHRDPRYFYPFPEVFWPDRWLEPQDRRSPTDVTEPFDKNVEVILDRRAFIPFSAGPRICVGRLLALAELRASISSIVQKFDIRVAEGCNLDDWEENLEDYYVMVKKSTLPVVLTERM